MWNLSSAYDPSPQRAVGRTSAEPLIHWVIQPPKIQPWILSAFAGRQWGPFLESLVWPEGESHPQPARADTQPLDYWVGWLVGWVLQQMNERGPFWLDLSKLETSCTPRSVEDSGAEWKISGCTLYTLHYTTSWGSSTVPSSPALLVRFSQICFQTHHLIHWLVDQMTVPYLCMPESQEHTFANETTQWSWCSTLSWRDLDLVFLSHPSIKRCAPSGQSLTSIIVQ